MIAFLISPIGRYVAGAAAIVIALGLAYAAIYSRGADGARHQIEKENTDARNKADDARLRSERGADTGRLREDDGFKRD